MKREAKIEKLTGFIRGAIKKNYQILDIVQTWGGGVSGTAKPFIDKRYGHVLRGRGVKGPCPK